MPEESTDIRVSRTKELLVRALIAMMQDTGPKCISVQSLTDKARISRVTFYRHYQGMPDFLDKVITTVLKGLLYPPDAEDFKNPESALAYYTKFFQHIKQHSEFFKAMLGPNSLLEFRQKYVSILQEWHREMFETHRNEFVPNANGDVLFAYFANGQLGIIDYWLRYGSKYSAEYIAEQFVAITHQPVITSQASI